MAQTTGVSGGQAGPDDDSRGVGEWLRQVFFAGAALTIPGIVTVVILVFAVNFLLGLVEPAVDVVTGTLNAGQDVPAMALEVLAVLTLVAIIFLVGLVAEMRSGGGIEESFDSLVARIPAVGPVYTSFNEMSELLLSSESQSFREVKLVEYPTRGSYTVAFVTAEAPESLETATGHPDMTTLFMPMAPNPVMGGFVVHVSTDRVHDIDITVEEGIQSILTSGVTIGSEERAAAVEADRVDTPAVSSADSPSEPGTGEAGDIE